MDLCMDAPEEALYFVGSHPSPFVHPASHAERLFGRELAQQMNEPSTSNWSQRLAEHRPMSSKLVRFTTSTGGSSVKRSRVDVMTDGNNSGDESEETTKRFRPNGEEQDDVDDWNGDAGYGSAPSEREVLEAKRQRRRQGAEAMDEATRIDKSTSLAAEGIQIEPFHMRKEESDGAGYFVGGTYVWRKHDPNEEADAWLDSLNDETNPAGKELFHRSELRENDDSGSSVESLTKEQLYMKIIPLVGGDETVTQAIRRYGGVASNKSRRNKNEEATSEQACKVAKTCLDNLTGLANSLLLKGEVDIYGMKRQRILSLVSSTQGKTLSPTEKQPPANWEYLGNLDGKIHGPFTTEQMIGWIHAGYFIGHQKVKIRTIRQKQLSQEEELLADLMNDDGDQDDRNEFKFEKGEWQWSDEINMKCFLP
eukprot:scaffold1352_cov144-Cylindrotheca_fusiformis.AAC.14